MTCLVMVESTPKTPQEQENDVSIIACIMIDEFPQFLFFAKLPPFIHRGLYTSKKPSI